MSIRSVSQFFEEFLNILLIFITQVTAVLEGEDGLGVSVPVSLLVADSLLAREMLRGHEAGQERLLTLDQVEGDTLRQYSQILRSGIRGSTVMRTRDRCLTSIFN